ncbi:MAG: CvpA family protein [Woeseiaceae bacterium]|nr:CvpA family protein [Woeseiaceae bacterium]
MPIIDILIAVAIVISIVVGLVRGFVKEAISIAALVFAIWAALYFGPSIGGVSENWFSSPDLQMWFGRILVFVVILAIGGLLGWAISKLVRLSALSGMDRFLGSLFGVVRGILLAAVAVIGGQFAGFDNDEWWLQSKLIPHLEVVADWIKVMAPEGLDLITPDKQLNDQPANLPVEV